MKQIRVTNMTSLFSKEMLIYSFFDLRLKSPLRVIAVFYFLLLFGIIGLPILWIFWTPNVYAVVVAIGVPVGGAILMSKPIWNGKSFLSFAKTQVKYFTRSKVLYDWKVKPKNSVYELKDGLTVSRHDDYNLLYQMVKNQNREDLLK